MWSWAGRKDLGGVEGGEKHDQNILSTSFFKEILDFHIEKEF